MAYPRFLLVGFLLLGGCTKTVPGQVVTLGKVGAACADASECDAMICNQGVCSRSCRKQDDCPVGFDCGLLHPEDATNGVGAGCYASTFTAVDTGGFGTPCGLNAADPKSGTACDPAAPAACATGFDCRARRACDPYAYCTRGCTSDVQCPPTYFCGQDTTTQCASDADCSGGFTCQQVTGGLKVCTSAQRCIRRAFCSDCATDDQCEPGSICTATRDGSRHCAPTCHDTRLSSDCPQPILDYSSGDLTGTLFETCVPSAGDPSVNVCMPTAGYCSGPSPGGSTKGANASFCSPCRIGVPGDCTTGVCIEDEFTHERFCSYGCTVTFRLTSGGFNSSNDTCEAADKDTTCIASPPETCHTCTVAGHCAYVDQKTDPKNGYFLYGAQTCYPLEVLF